MTANMPIGSDERINADARPSAAKARILRRILKRWRITDGKIFQDFAEIAAGRALDRDRGHEQRQVVWSRRGKYRLRIAVSRSEP